MLSVRNEMLQYILHFSKSSRIQSIILDLQQARNNFPLCVSNIMEAILDQFLQSLQEKGNFKMAAFRDTAL
jgi:hypothetical protein